MDTKLKNNKKSLNWMIYLISISIITSMIAGVILSRNGVHSKDSYMLYSETRMDIICDVVPGLAMYSNDISGNLKEESIEAEVNNRKSQVELYKSGLENVRYYEEDLYRSDEEIRQNVIYSFKQYVEDNLRQLRELRNVEFYYESQTDGKIYTNTDAESKEEFKEEAIKNDVRNLYEKNGVYARIAEHLSPGDQIFDAKEECNKKLIKEYSYLAIIGVCFFNIIFSIIRLLINKKKQTLEIKEGFWDKLYWSFYIEFKVIILFTLIGSILSIVESSYGFHVYFLIVVPLLAFVVYIVILDLIKLTSLKDEKRLLRNKSLVFNVLRYIKVNLIGYVKETKLIKSTFSKVIAVMCIFTLLMIVFLILLIFPCFSLYGVKAFIIRTIVVFTILFGNMYILKVGSALNNIVTVSEKISEGNYDEKIDAKNVLILKEIADNIENIQSGLKVAVDQAVKSEKMKGELITNVSHDLKTPLTSIINYVNLLDQENISEEDREKYIKVLKEKSNRLKVLIEDLFEVSKASSGSMELNMDNIDVVSLLRQTLVELEDKIEASGLRFIKSFPNEKIIIYADGRKLFRVFQNLLSNIFKYAMKNSRVYIEVKDSNDYVEVVFKNISEYELNFTEEEILQRFKRGDESRTTEGSGLGLSIAKSLVELQKGKFDICIDGDLFKVTVKLVKNN